jgi:hypothetical protein
MGGPHGHSVALKTGYYSSILKMSHGLVNVRAHFSNPSRFSGK